MSNSRPAMPVRDRKLLWAKAAGRCSICKKLVVNTETGTGDGVVVGVESHIAGHSVDGPRGKSEMPMEHRHKYSNMVLLCMEHSKIIDENDEHWTEDMLRTIKESHEEDMRSIGVDDTKGREFSQVRLVEPTGSSTGGPKGHFTRFTLRNFGNDEIINLNCWVSGWGYIADLVDPGNRSFLESKQTIAYELKVDGTPVFTEAIPFLRLNARYDDLNDNKIIYKTDLEQRLVKSQEFYDIKIGEEMSYSIVDSIYTYDRMEMLDSLGGFVAALFWSGENRIQIKVTRTLLSCWGIKNEWVRSCLSDLGEANIQIMHRLNAFQDKDYSTYSFEETNLIGLDRFKHNLDQIVQGRA